MFSLVLIIYKVWLSSIYQLVHLRSFTLYGLYSMVFHICITAWVVQCHVLYISMYFLSNGLFHVLYFISRPIDSHIFLISSFRWFGSSLLYSRLGFHVIRYRHNDRQLSLLMVVCLWDIITSGYMNLWWLLPFSARYLLATILLRDTTH